MALFNASLQKSEQSAGKCNSFLLGRLAGEEGRSSPGGGELFSRHPLALLAQRRGDAGSWLSPGETLNDAVRNQSCRLHAFAELREAFGTEDD